MRQAFFVDIPHKSKRKYRATIAATRRWATDSVSISAEDSDEEIIIDLNDLSAKEQLEFSLGGNIDVSDIEDLFEIVKNQTSIRSLSVLVYLSITYFGVTWRKVDIFLKELGALGAEICNRWSDVFIQGDLNKFFEDNRGGKRGLSFFDIYPELESMAKLYAFESRKRKSSSFIALELAQYLNKQCYKLTGKASGNLSSFD